MNIAICRRSAGGVCAKGALNRKRQTRLGSSYGRPWHVMQSARLSPGLAKIDDDFLAWRDVSGHFGIQFVENSLEGVLSGGWVNVRDDETVLASLRTTRGIEVKSAVAFDRGDLCARLERFAVFVDNPVVVVFHGVHHETHSPRLSGGQGLADEFDLGRLAVLE